LTKNKSTTKRNKLKLASSSTRQKINSKKNKKTATTKINEIEYIQSNKKLKQTRPGV
jgi:hypothetical protein